MNVRIVPDAVGWLVMTSFICSNISSATLNLLILIANETQETGRHLPVTLAKQIRLFLVVNDDFRVYLSCASQNDSSNSLRILDNKTILIFNLFILYSPETGAPTITPG